MRWLVCVPNTFPIGWHLNRHSHPDQHEFVLVLAGRLCTQMAGKSWLAEPGTAVLHPAGVDHEETALGGRPLRTLFLGWQSATATAGQDLPVQVEDRQGRLAMTMRWLMEVCAQGTAASQQAGLGLIEGLLFEFRRLAARPEDLLVQAVSTFARTRLAQPLRLGDLARAGGLSRHHFARRFRASTGSSPMHFLRSMRMQRAHHLLVTTELPIAEVARQVGFEDRFHFTRVFRQEIGLPPGRIRSALQS